MSGTVHPCSSVRRETGPGRLFPSQCLSTPGDGGNDVSMIQAADCGIGIEGKVRVSSATLVSTRLRACSGPARARAEGQGWPGTLPAP